MQKITPLGRWTEEIYQICLCCEHYWQFPKNPEGQDLGEWLDSFCFISIYTFRSFKNPFAMIINLSELYFTFRFILFVKTKKMISMNYHSWKPWRWVKFDLMLTIKDIYINTNLNPLTKFTSSSRSSEFRNILQWNISKMITKTVPISTRMVLTYVMKPSIPLWIWWKSVVTETTTWSEFSNGESHCRTNTSIRRNK